MRWNPVTIGLLAALVICFVAVPALAATADVAIRGGSYYPASLTIESNTTVTWTNFDPVSHTVTSTSGIFDSGPIEEDETFEYTFDDTGTYPYGCTLNASTQRTPMQGVVIVVPEGMIVTPGEEPTNTTVASVINGSEFLTTFAGALESTEVTRLVLTDGGPYTVFAPGDDAFEVLGNETLAAVSNDTELLETLLMHHVVDGALTVDDLMAEANATGNGTTLETLTGDALNVSIVDGSLMIGNATILVADLAADNGIVHIIDMVLVPEGLIPPENETPAENVTPAVNVTPGSWVIP
jgi:uncharacterized surface protein with fasciclin (FAS1) repeats/plastocyanin